MKLTDVGGYIAFDLLGGVGKNQLSPDEKHVHFFSLGRHCLEAACRSLRPLRAHVPFFICDAVTQVFEKLGIPIVRYALSANLLPRVIDYRDEDLLLIVNYLGLCAQIPEFADYLALNSHRRVIIDNTHSMGLDNQFSGLMSFVSPRKFIPVPDGGILYDPRQTIAEACLPYRQDCSWDRVGWLFRCLDEGGRQPSYAEYVAHREAMQSLPYALMSNTTRSLLDYFDIQTLLQARASNFERLAHQVPIEPIFAAATASSTHSAIGYPVRVKDAESAQRKLAASGIYTVRYWPELSKRSLELNSTERLLLDHMLVLPTSAPIADQHLDRINTVLA